MTPDATRRLVANNRARAAKINDRLIGAMELLVEDAENLTPNEHDAPLTVEERYEKKRDSARYILERLDTPLVRALIDAKEMADDLIPLGAADNPQSTTDEQLAMRVLFTLAKGMEASKREKEAIEVDSD